MPSTAQRVADLAGLLADSTRAAFCLALLDGRAWTASELAAHARVALSTASEHLSRLVGSGLLVERRQGRHRYVQLADAQAAELVEGFVAYLSPVREEPRSLRAATTSAALARGRTCYDHLAGRLGVRITDAMAESGLLDTSGGFALTGTGIAWFASIGVEEAELRRTRRPLARSCLDWTERRSHLGGAAGARLCERFLSNGWVKRIGSNRAVRVTPGGDDALRDLLGITDL
ncbi:ArsR family transcriptional regulator [Saccharopolyspora erythraea NRRL 2338]|uniref:ArsR-family transcriptional regulator n=2 Tax=Saccharopolyspora erythraea TaxID=1836 RepID=A4F7L9_SACEN|nr:winged helix-turn-helix domain-containing protein [Saccharopolyspora erythraea]EQD87046.1 ArsR family transcriptional regulator [Saccharopolyspora erythraea D]PFG93847.1 ArsR family transcriptional regulator [Saccharopolyspora erythraea NRRL 2338]QRK90673.1 winged helix-turn-helix transcriptional regulator [Saccharopolyspora erythraea]CAM00043.1 ArsR-family transcriptional regulator [Saccharopolyspora erythraea NRRL 2338]